MSETRESSRASRRLYYDDSYTIRFQARVAGAGVHDGRTAVELDATYFYPESGGQEADRGTLNGIGVVDVQAEDEGRIWHVVEHAPEPGSEVLGEVDWARRFDHMQQHTGQHILSAAFDRVLGAATISSRLGDERCTVEVALAEVSWRTIENLEREANAVVWSDRPVERHWVNEAGLERFKLRKPPRIIRDRFRIVEIPDWDVSACGGTHTRRTGEVGLIKVLRWEKVRGNLRFDFVCGGRALEDHAWRTHALMEAARRRTVADRELLQHLERAAAERDVLAKRLDELERRQLGAEARERVGRPPNGVADFARDRPREQVRRFAIECLEAGAPWVACGASAPDAVVVIGRSKAGSQDLRALLPALIERARGKGGGTPDLIQVSARDGACAEAAWEWVLSQLEGRQDGS